MKKSLLLVAAMLLMSTVAAFAQPRAVGLRFGTGLEASYQHSLGESNMISVDFGMIYPTMSIASPTTTTKMGGNKTTDHASGTGSNGMIGVEAAATYDWINPGGVRFPWSHKGSWNWYVGVGADVAYMHIINVGGGKGSHWGSVGVAGRIGVEYNFWFPLQLSFDYRPVIGPAFSAFSYDINVPEIGLEEKAHVSTVAYNLSGLYAGAICFAVRYKF
ncbi:MAG: hypothetical protein MJ007_00875 [Paludibacteraceae bacterium]|nr:hypothetical protein [Paludibacteraceae bacterium]